MHVLVIPSWFSQYPGDPSGSFFATQASGVQALGVQVGMIYPDLRSVRQARQYAGGRTSWTDSGAVPVLRHTYVNWTPRFEPMILARWVAAGMRLFDAYCARYGRPDLIHAHCLLRAGVLAERIFREHGVAYVVTEHSSRWHLHQASAYELPRARLAARNARALICVSHDLLTHMRRDLVLGRTYVVPNAVDPSFLAGELSAAPGAAGLAFINVALLNPGKRHDLLIEAFFRAFGGVARHTLTIVGAGPQRRALEQQIAALGIGASVRLAGFQSKGDVVRLLAQSNCFVLASDHETFGVVVTEALAMGLPVVSTRCGGTDDIVTGKNGILAEAGNAAALAAALVEMEQAIPARRFSAAAIRAACAAQFGQPAVAARLRDIYADAIA